MVYPADPPQFTPTLNPVTEESAEDILFRMILAKSSASFLSLAVIETHKNRTPRCHIVVTGRNAPDKRIAIADLVTEMKEIKHPFRDRELKAKKGVEF